MPRPALCLALVLWFLAPAAHARLCPFNTETVRRIVSCRQQASLSDCRKVVGAAGCSVVRELESIHAVVIELPLGGEEAADAQLTAMPQVSRVEKDPKVNWLRASERVSLREPLISAERTLRELIQESRPVERLNVEGEAVDPEQPWGIRRVNAAGAWGATQGKGVRVAVIDTGIDASHPDLRANVAGGVNVVDPKQPANFADDQGHGTHVAGTIAAARDGSGVVGVAPQAKLYAVKVLDAEGNGNYDDIIAGIEWSAKNRMQVVNMSLGADESSEALRSAVAAAAKKGVVIVAAAGNTGGPVSYPAAYPETIAVAASAQNDTLADFSSRGPQIAFIAPGTRVKSAKLGGGWESHDGTSMAAPHVSGLAALAVSLGARGHAGVLSSLTQSASLLPGIGPEGQGRGMIDAGKLAP